MKPDQSAELSSQIVDPERMALPGRSVFDLWPAFVAGFKASGQGFNGDIIDAPQQSQAVREAFARWVKS